MLSGSKSNLTRKIHSEQTEKHGGGVGIDHHGNDLLVGEFTDGHCGVATDDESNYISKEGHPPHKKGDHNAIAKDQFTDLGYLFHDFL